MQVADLRFYTSRSTSKIEAVFSVFRTAIEFLLRSVASSVVSLVLSRSILLRSSLRFEKIIWSTVPIVVSLGRLS